MENPYPMEFTPQCPQVAWLREHLGGWQFGEQELLLAVTSELGAGREVLGGLRCIEIGAGDGDSLPLTIDRFYQSGSDCILFEADDESRYLLSERYPRATVNGTYSGQPLPPAMLVVIDIDGQDSVVMRQVMERDKPAVVVCEHMDRCYPITTTAPNPIPTWLLGREMDSSFRIQDTAETLHWMAGQLGYERFGYNRCNSFFVRRDRFQDLFR